MDAELSVYLVDGGVDGGDAVDIPCEVVAVEFDLEVGESILADPVDQRL